MPHEPSSKRRYSLFSKPLKSCVEPLVRPVLKAKGNAASVLVTQWPELVGKEMARYSLPIKITFPKDKNSGGTLLVACEGAHALTFQHLQPVLLERIASYFGYVAIARIQIEQRPLSQPAPRSRKPAKKSASIDTAALHNVHDPDIKAALSSLAKSWEGDKV